jgi:type IV secretory pathway TraG/TraD family ATPase VirD4
VTTERGRNRQRQPGTSGAGIWLLVGAAIAALAASWTSVQLGHRMAGLPHPPNDPWVVLFGVLDGTVVWPRESTYVLAGMAALLLLAAGGAWSTWKRSRQRRSRVDWTARVLGSGREVEGISRRSVTATAERLGVDSRLPGLPIGRTVASGELVYGSWEDVQILIAGPRVGKSVAFAVPAIIDAPGAVLVTSNKRDVVDATRDVRANRDGGAPGEHEVWVFDPQSIANEEPTTWWWNPLSYVTDEVKAATLAEHFASGSRAADAKTDAFFDPAGRDLLAGLLLAAALDERPITDVYRWLTRPTDDTPVDILKAYDYRLVADLVAGVIEAPDKQRGGVYGTAQQMASCLTNRAVLRWVTDDGHGRREFDPHAFVRSTGTLYSLSKEGRGTAGPLVTALTVAVVEAAELLATTQSGGRLRTPLVGVLDEAANVCRWRDLPDLYSHYGSRGIVLMTILQSWSQGEEVWGRAGMNKLWSASNVAIYAGGVKEEEFLERLSRLIGSYDKETRSVSRRSGSGGAWSTGSAQTSRQLTRERILEVDDLGALPKGRAVVLSSGNRPTLVKTIPWMVGPHADAIAASVAAHDPSAQQTLDEASTAVRHITATDHPPASGRMRR